MQNIFKYICMYVYFMENNSDYPAFNNFPMSDDNSNPFERVLTNAGPDCHRNGDNGSGGKHI